jgi:uncharacterized protein YkwD
MIRRFPSVSFVLIAALLACLGLVLVAQITPRFLDARPVPVTGEGVFGGCGGPLIDAVDPGFEQAVIEQTNEIRMEHGLPPLKWQDDLARAARYHTADMSQADYFDHNTYARTERDLELVCDTWSRIETYYPDWQALAENIAAGQRTPEMAMNGWMNSPDHRINILSPDYTELGVGFYEGPGGYRFYWGQNFGRRSDVYPLIIAGEKARTTSTDVPVYIHGQFDAMRLQVNGSTWTEWLPFKNQMTLRLPAASGVYTVRAQLRGPDGEYAASDSIELALKRAR